MPEQTVLGFDLAESPFAALKERAALGSLYPSEASDKDKQAMEVPFCMRTGRMRLTDMERREIGATRGLIRPVAEEYGVSEYYVAQLRRRYRSSGL